MLHLKWTHLTPVGAVQLSLPPIPFRRARSFGTYFRENIPSRLTPPPAHNSPCTILGQVEIRNRGPIIFREVSQLFEERCWISVVYISNMQVSLSSLFVWRRALLNQLGPQLSYTIISFHTITPFPKRSSQVFLFQKERYDTIISSKVSLLEEERCWISVVLVLLHPLLPLVRGQRERLLAQGHVVQTPHVQREPHRQRHQQHAHAGDEGFALSNSEFFFPPANVENKREGKKKKKRTVSNHTAFDEKRGKEAKHSGLSVLCSGRAGGEGCGIVKWCRMKKVVLPRFIFLET